MKEKEERLIKEYYQAVDLDVKEYVESIISGKRRLDFMTVAFLSEPEAEKIRLLTGREVLGNRVVLDESAVRHILKRHGKDGKQDQSMSNSDDIARIGYVLSHFDDITLNGDVSYNHVDENGKPSPMIQFSKRIDGTFYVVQTVSSVKNKRNYVVTAYIKKKQPSNP